MHRRVLEGHRSYGKALCVHHVLLRTLALGSNVLAAVVPCFRPSSVCALHHRAHVRIPPADVAGLDSCSSLLIRSPPSGVPGATGICDDSLTCTRRTRVPLRSRNGQSKPNRTCLEKGGRELLDPSWCPFFCLRGFSLLGTSY